MSATCIQPLLDLQAVRSPPTSAGWHLDLIHRAVWPLAVTPRNRTPHRDRVIYRGGVLFRLPFVDLDGRKRSGRRTKARSRLRVHDADIKSAGNVHDSSEGR
jgi:hypothetical protein